MDKTWDILGFGSAAVDDFLVVDRFPDPDTKQELREVDRQGGGLVATALVTAARLGAHTAYAEILGDDALSQWIAADLQREGIDVSLIEYHPHIRPIHGYIIVAQQEQTRTILYQREGPPVTPSDYPSAEAIRRARVLLIDDINQTNVAAILRAAQAARAAGVPIVADFELTPNRDLLEVVDHLVVSRHFAAQATGETDPLNAARRLWHPGRAAVVITGGAAGCWVLTDAGVVHHQPAFAVNAVDTTGCGDVFHGAYTAALTWNWQIEQRVRFASACAAFKATQLGGRRGIPTRAQVEAFLASV